MLADIPTGALTDVDRARLAFLRASNKLCSLADPTGAKKLIDDASQTSPGAGARLHRRLSHDVLGRDGQAGRGQSSHRRTSPLISYPTIVATWRSPGDRCGRRRRRPHHRSPRRCRRRIRACGPLCRCRALSRFLIADGRIGALLQSGRIAEASSAAERVAPAGSRSPRGRSGYLVPPSWGARPLATGRLDTACSLLGPVVGLLSGSGETHRLGVPLPDPTHHCARHARLYRRGRRRAGRRWRNSAIRVGDAWTTSTRSARAWVTACQGAISEAIKTVLSAAETACANGQFAAEVMCLQTATQFGERSCAPRLRELAAIVEGPRVGVAARFAAALRGWRWG